jgi:hypothetical protein
MEYSIRSILANSEDVLCTSKRLVEDIYSVSASESSIFVQILDALLLLPGCSLILWRATHESFQMWCVAVIIHLTAECGLC